MRTSKYTVFKTDFCHFFMSGGYDTLQSSLPPIITCDEVLDNCDDPGFEALLKSSVGDTFCSGCN